MDAGTFVALATLAISVLGSVVYLGQRAGQIEQRLEAFASKEDLSALRERLSLAEQKHVSTREAVDDLHGTLKEFREDMKVTLREFREEIKRLVDERLGA